MAAAAPSDWLQEDSRRMLHVVYRVGDMQKHIDFYTQLLGMKLLRQRDIPQDKYSNAFLGYGPEETNFAGERWFIYLLLFCLLTFLKRYLCCTCGSLTVWTLVLSVWTMRQGEGFAARWHDRSAGSRAR